MHKVEPLTMDSLNKGRFSVKVSIKDTDRINHLLTGYSIVQPGLRIYTESQLLSVWCHTHAGIVTGNPVC